MSAVRVARGVTGRDKIIKMAGHYHGHVDALLVQAGSAATTLGTPNSPGVTAGATADTILCPFNDLTAVAEAFARFPGQVAAVLLEPVAGNMGLVPPRPGYLEGLRDLTRDRRRAAGLRRGHDRVPPRPGRGQQLACSSLLLDFITYCANVANLLLVRTSQRERELAVRSALGGNRADLLRQMLVESLVLALVGAALGVALAWAGIQVLKAIGPQNLPRLDQVGLDPMVLGFTAAAAIASALMFGVVPALRASRVDVADMLRAGGRSSSLSGAGKWLRAGVVTAEVALAFVLLVGSGLMIRSFIALQQAQPGFDPQGS